MNNVDIEPIKQEIEKIKSWVTPITNHQECKEQADNLKAIKIKIKEIDEKRTELVKPLNDTVAKINAIFKPFLDECKSLKDTMERNILAYQRIEIERQQEEERQRREAEIERLAAEQKRLEEEAAKNNSNIDLGEAIKIEDKIEAVENMPSQVVKGVRSDWASTRIRDKWTYKVVDPRQVPQEYCSPDHNKIMAAIKSGERNIPGLEIINEGSVATY